MLHLWRVYVDKVKGRLSGGTAGKDEMLERKVTSATRRKEAPARRTPNLKLWSPRQPKVGKV